MRQAFIAVIFLICGVAFSLGQSCNGVDALAYMARARSAAVLTAQKRDAPPGYRAQIIFAARMLELEPMSAPAARSLLNLIPKDEEQERIVMTLGDSLCDADTFQNMDSLDRLGSRLGRDFAMAVNLVPGKMKDYVAYGYVTADDPHSDYLVQMQRVCRQAHSPFVKAVNSLPTANSPDGEPPTPSRQWFRSRLFDPDRCRALVLPEAE